jgi:hypothetical protein
MGTFAGLLKIAALVSLAAVLAFPPGAALAQQGTSSSYGTVGWGPRIPRRRLRLRTGHGTTPMKASIERKTGPSGSTPAGRRANILGCTKKLRLPLFALPSDPQRASSSTASKP